MSNAGVTRRVTCGRNKERHEPQLHNSMASRAAAQSLLQWLHYCCTPPPFGVPQDARETAHRAVRVDSLGDDWSCAGGGWGCAGGRALWHKCTAGQLHVRPITSHQDTRASADVKQQSLPCTLHATACKHCIMVRMVSWQTAAHRSWGEGRGQRLSCDLRADLEVVVRNAGDSKRRGRGPGGNDVLADLGLQMQKHSCNQPLGGHVSTYTPRVEQHRHLRRLFCNQIAQRSCGARRGTNVHSLPDVDLNALACCAYMVCTSAEKQLTLVPSELAVLARADTSQPVRTAWLAGVAVGSVQVTLHCPAAGVSAATENLPSVRGPQSQQAHNSAGLPRQQLRNTSTWRQPQAEGAALQGGWCGFHMWQSESLCYDKCLDLDPHHLQERRHEALVGTWPVVEAKERLSASRESLAPSVIRGQLGHDQGVNTLP